MEKVWRRDADGILGIMGAARGWPVLLLVVSALGAAVCMPSEAEPTVTRTATAVPAPSPLAASLGLTPTPAQTLPPTPSPTPTPLPTPTVLPAMTPTLTPTPTLTQEATPTPSPSPSPSPTPLGGQEGHGETEAPTGCVSDPAPRFTAHTTELSKIDSINPPVVVSGNVVKSRSYLAIGRDPSGQTHEVPVYAPVDSHLVSLVFYVQPMLNKAGEWADVEQYTMSFQASCEVSYGFDHLWRLADSIAAVCWQSAQVGQIRTREDYYYEELRVSSLRVLL